MVRGTISLRHLGLMLLLSVSGLPGCGTEHGDGWTGAGGGMGGGVGGGTGGGVGGGTGGGVGDAGAGGGVGDAGAGIPDGGSPATCAPAVPWPGVYILTVASDDESCAPSLDFVTVQITSGGEISFVAQNDLEVREVCSDSFAFRLYGANPSTYVDYSGTFEWSQWFSGTFEATGHGPGKGPDCSTTATVTMTWLIID